MCGIKDIPVDAIHYEGIPESHRLKPAGVMLVCLACDTLIVNPSQALRAFPCPHCGHTLTPVQYFAVTGTKDRIGTIVTEPN